MKLTDQYGPHKRVIEDPAGSNVSDAQTTVSVTDVTKYTQERLK